MATKAGREAWLTMVQLWFLDGYAHDRILEVAGMLELAPGLLKALTHLDSEDGARMGDLAEQWRCDASYITTLADALEERGFATRQPDPRDRRAKTLVLTPAGHKTRARAIEMLSEPPPFLDVLTPAEQRELRDLLRKVATADVRIAERASA